MRISFRVGAICVCLLRNITGRVDLVGLVLSVWYAGSHACKFRYAVLRFASNWLIYCFCAQASPCITRKSIPFSSCCVAIECFKVCIVLFPYRCYPAGGFFPFYGTQLRRTLSWELGRQER